MEALGEQGRDPTAAPRATVFELARGVARVGWVGARFAYRLAGRSGSIARLYGRARARPPAPRGGASIVATVLGKGLRAWAEGTSCVVVDHPLLVEALSGHPGIVYQHGELVAPPASFAAGAHRVLVPTEAVRRAFEAHGVASERLIVTGVCVEPRLARAAASTRAARLRRLERAVPRCVALFSSGAEPRAHVAALVRAARSLRARGHDVVAFAQRGGRFERALRALPAGIDARIFRDRADLHGRTMEAFARFDLFVSPPHERTCWAVGLGLPMALIGPDIGPFAPLNRALLLAEGAAIEIRSLREASSFGERVARMARDGALAAMNRRAEGVDVSGFATIARVLADPAFTDRR